MISQIVFSIDFLFHDFSIQATNHQWLAKLFSPCIKQATNCKVQYLDKLINSEGEYFSRKKFYELSNIYDVAEGYFSYDINGISNASWNYFKNFVDTRTIILGVELGLDLRKKLDELGIIYLNFWFHSFKLFDDLPFLVGTNEPQVFNKLKKYKIPEEQFYFYAKYWEIYISENKIFNDSSLEDNSLLFIGQTFKDKSVLYNGVYHNILNYKKKLEEYSKHYNKIYYLPHPFTDNTIEIDNYIDTTDYVQKLANIPTYYLLTSNKIKKVIGLSSSVLYEAQYFDKDVEYLLQPLFDIDKEFGLNSFVSVYNDYFNPYFWSDILSPIMNTNKNVINKTLFYSDKNKIRDIRNLYWGYKFLDKDKRLERTISKRELGHNTNIPQQSLLKTIFSVTNTPDKSHKQLCVLGIKMNFQKKKHKDYSLNSGERQTTTSLDNIRKDHINRYQTAVKYIKQLLNTSETLSGLDVFCGNGYGSYLLSQSIENAHLLSIDGSSEAIELAKNYYQTPNISFENKLFPFKLQKNKYDFAISLESIEHIKNDKDFIIRISKALKQGGLLIISTPNNDKLNLEINPNNFHFRHYRHNDFIKFLQKQNFEVLNFFGQDTYKLDEYGKVSGVLNDNEMELIEKAEKQFNIYICRKN